MSYGISDGVVQSIRVVVDEVVIVVVSEVTGVLW